MPFPHKKKLEITNYELREKKINSTANFKRETRVVLGADLGIGNFGYGVVAKQSGNLKYVTSGIIKTKNDIATPQRLKIIFDKLQEIINKFNPTEIALEEIFFGVNEKTAFNVGLTKGIAMLLAAKENLSCYEYTPLQIKIALTGYGRASKEQIMYMVKNILQIKNKATSHEYDALAVAICHINSVRIKSIY